MGAKGERRRPNGTTQATKSARKATRTSRFPERGISWTETKIDRVMVLKMYSAVAHGLGMTMEEPVEGLASAQPGKIHWQTADTNSRGRELRPISTRL